MLQKRFIGFIKSKIILFDTEDKTISLPVQVAAETVQLNGTPFAGLSDGDRKTIISHIGNALAEALKESGAVAAFSAATRHEGSSVYVERNRL